MNGEQAAASEPGTNWRQLAIDACEGLAGSLVAGALTTAVLDRVHETHVSLDAPHTPEGVSELLASVLDDIAGLAWHARQVGLALDQHCRLQTLEESFSAAGDGTLEMLVSAMLYFDASRYAYDHGAVKQGLDALDRALPFGAMKSDFPIIQAIEIFADVGQLVDQVWQASVNVAGHREMNQGANKLPTAQLLDEINERASVHNHEKARDWLLHTTMLLPMPESSAGKLLEGIEDYFVYMQRLADFILVLEETDDNRKSVVYYRRSRASYALDDVDLAMRDIGNAIRLLDKNQHSIFDQYYNQLRLYEQERSSNDRLGEKVREALAGMESDLRAEQQRLESEIIQSAERERELSRQQVSDALFRVVEILGVFLALIGLLGSTIGTTLFSEGSIGERIGMLGLGFAGTLLFFVMLRVIVGRDGLKFWRRS